ncbi:restriction endonuclease subunit S [Streptomyces fungicidicus]|uniref:restriction endonuclease subunit S n=1 Tax=Streptomyces fungicidicus TaxID=68203 RepID=UPI00332238F4
MSEGGTFTELPEGWAWAKLGEIADSALGKMLDRKKGGDHPVPYLRNVNVQWGRINTQDVLIMSIPPEQQEFFRVRKGDLLVCEGGEVGRCAVFEAGDEKYLAFQKALHRVRPLGGVSSSYLRYYLEYLHVTGGFDKFTTGSTIKHLPQQQLKRLPVRVPPVQEQRRIVAVLEQQLSRLDVANATLHASGRRIDRYLQTVLHRMTSDYGMVRLRDVLASGLANGRSVPTRVGGFPVLRLTALSDTYVDFAQRKEGDWGEGEAAPFLVQQGDFLIARGNGSLPLVGRGALVADIPTPVAFPDTMIRVRPDTSKVLSDYLRIIWSSLAVRRQIESRARTTAGIHKVNQKILGGIEFPLPDLPTQRALCAQWFSTEQQARQLTHTVSVSKRRSVTLHRSLLAEAFTGRLVAQDSTDEPASELLARISAERVVAGVTTPRRRSPRQAPAQRKRIQDTKPTLGAPPPLPTDAPTLSSATQPTLDLEIPS